MTAQAPNTNWKESITFISKTYRVNSASTTLELISSSCQLLSRIICHFNLSMVSSRGSVSVSVTQAGVGRPPGLCRTFRKSDCCLRGAASKQATHQERGSEECFLLDCLSCAPLPCFSTFFQTYSVCVLEMPLHILAEERNVYLCVCKRDVHVRTAECFHVFSTRISTTSVVGLSQWDLLFFWTACWVWFWVLG